MNRPELEHTGAWPLVGIALALLAWALAVWAWFATQGLTAHLGRVLPAHAVALLAVICGHRARAAIRRGQEPAGGSGLASTALWLGYAVLLTALPALGFVVFFLCCGVVG
ncbi:hypothetical protein LVB77_09125 [Lysobacter sp. 5GHs7-4]|uniref:hypothetical protein n=1 Tax=Lysobacter sp. 5GHs7-4 TaxID=2904253 RepID=UPI001E2B4F7A|nr:hypothetical protein [Lysobacter sp. 5GHs7-4]UHQ24815.1 hypothetical protein LVB77_09125 [Lysobacter sp. 5GHs7-4]